MTQNKQLSLPISSEAAKNYYNGLSPYPFVSDIPEHGVWRARKANAVQFRSIQHNTEYKLRLIAFDVDIDKIPRASDALSWWQDINAPAPNWILINPKNGNAHYLYQLETPVLKGSNAKRKPLEYAAAVERGLTELLQSDKSYGGLISKNPLSGYWETHIPHTESYTLEELADYVDMTIPKPKKRELNGLGRHCLMFDELRWWSYSRVLDAKENGGFEQWFNACLIRSQQLNTFNNPLPYSSLKSTAKSVAKWTWTKYIGKGGKKRGRDSDAIKQWQGELDLRDRQALAAQVTNACRKAVTKQKILTAVKQLQAENKRVTQSKVAKVSGLGIATVKRNWSIVKIGIIRCTSDNRG